MSDIKFIRRNGRIIPIKQKKKEAAGLVGAGIGFSAVSGYISGNVLKKAEKISQMSFDFGMDAPFSKLPKGVKSAAEGMNKASIRLKIAKVGLKSSRVIGATLIGLGTQKLSESYGIDNSPIGEFSSEATGVIAAGLANSFFRKGFHGIKVPKVKIPKGLLKDLFSKQVRMKL